MKRVCKNIDIADEELIKKAIRRCMKNKSRKKRQRQDIVRIYKEYGTDEAIAHMMAAEIKSEKAGSPPCLYERNGGWIQWKSKDDRD